MGRLGESICDLAVKGRNFNTNSPRPPIYFRILGVTKVFGTSRFLQNVLFLTDSVFIVLFAYFDESIANKLVYKP